MTDNVIPQNKWAFNEDVVSCFDDMLERSIPEYTMMRKLVTDIGLCYAKNKTCIVDIGCSNGNAIKPFVDKCGASNTYKLYDVSKPMLEKCHERYSVWTKLGLMEIADFDITKGIPSVSASVVLSVLTLQFTPIEYRHKILKSIYDALLPNGALVIVEKVLGNTSEIDSLFVDKYYDMKAEHSYTSEQIQSKRKSLEGVLVPITARWNEDLLKQTGFSQIDCFWRCLNFAGWIAVK